MLSRYFHCNATSHLILFTAIESCNSCKFVSMLYLRNRISSRYCTTMLVFLGSVDFLLMNLIRIYILLIFLIKASEYIAALCIFWWGLNTESYDCEVKGQSLTKTINRLLIKLSPANSGVLNIEVVSDIWDMC